MIIYSVTISIEESLKDEWLDYMTGQHIPDVMATGYFSSHSLQRLVAPEPEPGSLTYNIQYVTESMGKLQAYMELRAPALQAEHTEKFGARFVAFRSVLERLA